MFEIDYQGSDWIHALPVHQSKIIDELIASGQGEEQIAELWLSKIGAPSTVGFGANGTIQNFYGNVKTEVVKMLCGDAKYEKDRSEAKEIWEKHGKLSLVSAVSAVIGSTVGLAAAAIIPVVALLFSMIGKIGIGAFCATCSPTPTKP